ncbi:MAG TPA: hypothetical protein VLA71_07880 [Algoriphagus sp.]|nr:hypothetical protein [Algoriphagus sp.]
MRKTEIAIPCFFAGKFIGKLEFRLLHEEKKLSGNFKGEAKMQGRQTTTDATLIG